MNAAAILKAPPAGVDLGAEFSALRDCAAAVIKAADGRGVRWARVGCVKRLQDAGRSTEAAQELTEATIRWAASWAPWAAAQIAGFKAGALA